MEQTASLMVDNGEVITGSAPGNLRQLNAKAGLYIGTVYVYMPFLEIYPSLNLLPAYSIDT